ncbi:lipoyl protein ligase domain-containing protein [Candidatus Pyrohabitans sp.]
MQTWRLLDTGKRSAAENLAIDEALLLARARHSSPNTLRFLQFSPNAALVGFHQSVELEIRESYCREAGIDINRRITGGGALYFDETQLGWEIIAPRGYEAFPKRVEELYEVICRGAVRGLRNLGIDAAFRPKNDIEVNGRKISGTGGALEEDVFLFQGTLLMDFDVETMLRALRIPTEKLKDKEMESVKERVTCVRWELGHLPALEEVKRALMQGFAREFELYFEEGELTRAEEKLYGKLLPKFKSREWIYGTRRAPEQRATLRAAKKTPGGLIRAQLVVDTRNERIHFALITGDFFAYPKRAIFDLEARLKDASAAPEEVEATVRRFFSEREVEIPGAGVEDFVEALLAALAKLRLKKYGIGIEEANRIFTVLEDFEGIARPKALLLPYCAKAKGCDLRYENACRKCGGCTVGKAYELAEELGLEAITIVNYEHLEETLRSLRERGIDAFIGTCCESFFIKHQHDFERLGLKGVLVDIDNTTCYDLGKVREAKKGKFREETTLKLELLEKVLRLKMDGG